MRTRSILFGTLIVALLAGVYVDSLVRDDVADQRWRLDHESRLVKTGCGTVEYGVAGSGNPVLVVHGAGGGFDQGLDIAAVLGDRGFTLIAPSRFGYLRSPVPAAPTAEAQADVFSCLLRELQLAPSMPVIGVSAGTSSAIQFCARHAAQCSALVLVAPVAGVAPIAAAPGESTTAEPTPRPQPSVIGRWIIDHALRYDDVLWLAMRAFPADLMQDLLGTPPADYARAAPQEQQRVMATLHGLLPIGDRAAGLRLDSQPPAQLDPALLRGIGVPVLLVAARNDGYGAAGVARALAAAIPGAKLVEYPDGGHLLVGHHLEAWIAVEEFLRALPACGTST